MRLAVLVSGSGTLLEAMFQANLPIGLVVADRPCRALDLVGPDIAAELLERTDWTSGFDRNGYAKELIDLWQRHEIDLVAMAGFGTILGSPVFDAYGGRVVNTHPALLPAFPGWHAVRDALAYGAKVTGCTIHVATEEVDDGPILAQRAVEIMPDDDEASLHERIKVVERCLYIETLRDIESHGGLGVNRSERMNP